MMCKGGPEGRTTLKSASGGKVVQDFRYGIIAEHKSWGARVKSWRASPLPPDVEVTLAKDGNFSSNLALNCHWASWGGVDVFFPDHIGCVTETCRQSQRTTHGSQHPGVFPVQQRPEPVPHGPQGPSVPVLGAKLFLQAQPGPQQPAAAGDPSRHQRHPQPLHDGDGLRRHHHHPAVRILHHERLRTLRHQHVRVLQPRLQLQPGRILQAGSRVCHEEPRCELLGGEQLWLERSKAAVLQQWVSIHRHHTLSKPLSEHSEIRDRRDSPGQ